MRLLALFTWTLATVSANPFPAPMPTDPAIEKRAPDCKAVNAALTILKALGPPATSFCSSYLRVPTAATTTFIAPAATVTVTTSTQTITSGLCPQANKRDEFIIERTANSIYRRPANKPLQKRIDIPALSAFAASKLSSGCSCLSITPKKTVTTTFNPPAQTTNVVATTTVCAACNPPGGACTIDNFIQACCNAPDGSVGCYFPGGDPYAGICFN
ncbi:hypothetical protein BKA63DRAFT_572206 [Paraphoma chrysanthemicola]|nr:hypothetical protein BKA63DRAFT_572206 [Paraphoma chrysanthemicola]